MKRTPLSELHREAGAKMVDFFGWDMPVEFTSLVAEHNAVRTAAGLFDVSHMGEIEIRGADALDLVQKITTNDAAKLGPGAAQYSALTYPNGTFVDDLVVYYLEQDRYLLVVNAANTDKDYAWIESHNNLPRATVVNASDSYCQIALQGPKSVQVLEPLVDLEGFSQLGYYRHTRCKVAGADSILSRTGYTGEDGFEVYCEASLGPGVWNALMDAGKPHAVAQCGLGARDTLRLEAKYALYGNDIDENTTVLEAGLGWIVKFKKGDFNGREALLAQKESGVHRKLIGFEMRDRGIPRPGYPVLLDGEVVGEVTSGTYAPFLKKAIGLTYLPLDRCREGTLFEVVIRGRQLKAEVVPTPFYKRAQ